MPTPLRVLILEDNFFDAELVVSELRRADYEPDWQRVETEAGFLTALDPTLDFILADYTLPSFDALRALQLLQERGLDIPFIVVTGTVNEGVVVECMKQGATDYLLKDRLGRLGPAVRRALEEKQTRQDRQRAQRALQESEQRYRILVGNMSEVLYRVTVEPTALGARVDFVSGGAQTITGHDPSEFIGNNDLWFSLLHPDDTQTVTQLTHTMLDTGRPSTRVYRIRHQQTGEYRWVEDKTVPIVDDHGRVVALQGVARDITERKLAEDDRQESLEKLRRVFQGTIHAVASILETRDPYTAGHSRRVGQLAAAIATEMGLQDEEVEAIRIAGILHDIGKIHVPAEILSKPSLLNEHEFGIIKAHPQVGYEILRNIEFPWPVAQIVQQHHERLDGSGYPFGLSGEPFLLAARVLAVADVVEAMSSHRPYRAALGIDRAISEIVQGSGTLYDPRTVDACVTLFRDNSFALD